MQNSNDDLLQHSNYSDDDIYNLLGLNRYSSSTELQDKIVQYIKTYNSHSATPNESLHDFFCQIFYRFFSLPDDDDVVVTNNKIENFTTDYFDSGNSITDSANINSELIDPGDIPPSTTTTASSSSSAPIITTSLPYAPGQINPILKQTYLRTITIDSQYRDTITVSNSTNFSFTLSENIKDVVSLRLYAVQIPYTWFTISNTFGSNVFYIKGVSDGIDDGTHDFAVSISPGNYNQVTLITALQASISALPAQYTDVNFGQTNITYNAVSCFASISINLNIVYGESVFEFIVNPDSDFVYPNSDRRDQIVSAFLGFNKASYTTNTVYSNLFTHPIDSQNSIFNINSANNVFTIKQYVNTVAPFVNYTGNSTVLQTFTFTIPSDIYTQYGLIAAINNVLAANNKFVDTNLTVYYESDVNSANYSYYQLLWKIQLNRFETTNAPNTKLVLLLPNDSIWIGPKCLNFAQTTNDVQYILGETPLASSNFVIRNNTTCTFKCNNANYDVDNINDFAFSIPATNTTVGYSLGDYIQLINTGISDISSNFIMSKTSAYIDTSSIFNLQIDISKTFNTSNYLVDISGMYLDTALSFNTSTLNSTIHLYDDISFSSTFSLLGAYSVISGQNQLLAITVDPANTNGVSSALSYQLLLPPGQYALSELQNIINAAMITFVDESGSNIMRNSHITFVQNNNTVTATLIINIQKIITQQDYSVILADSTYTLSNWASSSWASNLKLTSMSYNFADITQPVNQPFNIISGSGVVLSDTITLNQPTTISFQSLNVPGIASLPPLQFSIPIGVYSRQQLFDTINALFAANPITAGTTISYITDASLKLEYTMIQWNINKIFYAKDYKIVFYDLTSFVSCYLGANNVRNATWDTTLGWILGYRTFTEYPLDPSYSNYNIALNQNFYTGTDSIFTYDDNLEVATITGDSVVNIFLYNSFIIILDDFRHNHMNDSVITITPSDHQVSLPSYANRSIYQCDPITKLPTYNGLQLPNNNKLTQNQIYSINQIVNTQNTIKSIKNEGVFTNNSIAQIPLKLTGLLPGSTYLENGGSLKDQIRQYFGPVSINKVAVKLLSDKGDQVDLNGSNWSFQLLAECLYQSHNGKNNL